MNRSALSLKVTTHGRFAHAGEKFKGSKRILCLRQFPVPIPLDSLRLSP
jgi:hypothetical protein